VPPVHDVRGCLDSRLHGNDIISLAVDVIIPEEQGNLDFTIVYHLLVLVE